MIEMFREKNGKLSMMRVLVSLIVIVVLANYTFVTITTGKLPAADFGSIATMVTALGAKGMQRFFEKGESNGE